MTSDHIRRKAGALREVARRLSERSPQPIHSSALRAALDLRTLARHLDELAEEAGAFEEAAYEAFSRVGRAEGFLRDAAADANRETLRRALSMAGALRTPVLPESVTDLQAWRTRREEPRSS